VVTSETNRQPPQRREITDWLIGWIAKELGMPSEEIDAGRSLLDYSLSSLTATILVGDLEDWLDLRLSPSLVWDYPSIDAMTDYLVEKATGEEAATAFVAAAGGPAPGTARSTGPAQDARQLLEGLDQLSDDEVDALLSQFASSKLDGA
jgi:acyl carrier protein